MRAHATWFVIYLSVQSHSGQLDPSRQADPGSRCFNSLAVLCYGVCTTICPTSLSTADDACSRQSENSNHGLAGSGVYQKKPTVNHDCIHDCQPWLSTDTETNSPARPGGYCRTPIRGLWAVGTSPWSHSRTHSLWNLAGAQCYLSSHSRSWYHNSGWWVVVQSGAHRDISGFKNPVLLNTVPIVSSSAGSAVVSGQLIGLYCHVCVCARVQKLQYKQDLGYLAEQGAICMCMYSGEFTSSHGRVKCKWHVSN